MSKKMVSFRLDEEQYTLFQEKLKAAGKSQQAYLEELVMTGKVEDYSELEKIRYELYKQGVNLNQIARHMNAGMFEDLPGLEQAASTWKTLYLRIGDILNDPSV